MDLMDEEIAVGSLIDRVIAEVCDVVADVELSRSGDFENISGDEALLRQALLNLTRNAAEAAAGLSQRGRVSLQGSIERTAAQSVQRISVIDNGPGIPIADLSRIFVPFYTTKANGTGLGLAIVQKIIVQHGGTVQSANQQGAPSYHLATA
jgi:signal transduction histidine kinase